MDVSPQVTKGSPRFRIERSPVGYRVVGDGFLDWEPTLGEAASWREAMESPGWRRNRLPPIPGGGRGVPPGEAIVYGPVRSRRLGRSLGVRLTPPGAHVCSFDCVYCELRGGTRRNGWPSVDAIEAALADRLPQLGRIDAITISGDGEPTLHPDFPAVAEAVLQAAAAHRPGVPVGILTNGSRAVRPEVRRALDRLDECIVMVDAAAERIDRPAGDCPLGAIVYGISLLRRVTVQACFVDGWVSNVDRAAVRQWVELVRELRPRKVQITTIDRPAWKCDARPVPREQLEEIACLLRDRTGVEASVFA
jgi:wyosine [tRNA(Phe)-imidazoG37] synthetase (radical SAM superfamily)